MTRPDTLTIRAILEMFKENKRPVKHLTVFVWQNGFYTSLRYDIDPETPVGLLFDTIDSKYSIPLENVMYGEIYTFFYRNIGTKFSDSNSLDVRLKPTDEWFQDRIAPYIAARNHLDGRQGNNGE